jgi:CheY-like chemotaxis protein
VAHRVLIIEDDAEVRALLGEALAAAGVGVDLARDGLEGLERLREVGPPAAILLDLRMPRLGGEAFLAAMRREPRYDHVPVISMSAGPELPDRDAVAAHLHKPFDLDDLVGIVLSLCAHSVV